MLGSKSQKLAQKRGHQEVNHPLAPNPAAKRRLHEARPYQLGQLPSQLRHPVLGTNYPLLFAVSLLIIGSGYS